MHIRCALLNLDNNKAYQIKKHKFFYFETLQGSFRGRAGAGLSEMRRRGARFFCLARRISPSRYLLVTRISGEGFREIGRCQYIDLIEKR